MAYSSGIITAPVSIYDVQRAIHNSNADLGRLIDQGNINQWSKYKPVVFATVKRLTQQQWLMTNYGIINIPTWTRLSYMSIFLFSPDRGSLQNIYWPECDVGSGSLSLEYWAYQRPTGGVASPFRLTDFNGPAEDNYGYYHLAEQPIGPMPSNTITIEPTGNMHMRFSYGRQTVRTLKLSDLTWPGSTGYDIGEMYFGIIMRQLTGTLNHRTVAAVMKIGDDFIKMKDAAAHEFRVTVPADYVEAGYAGTWQIFPIISSVPFDPTSDLATLDGNKFIAVLPDHTQAINVGINYAQIIITDAIGYRNSDGRNANIIVSLSNTEDILRNYRVSIEMYDKYGTHQTTYDRSRTGQIAASGSATENFTIDIRQAWASFQGGTFIVRVTITDTLKFKLDSDASGTITDQTPQ